MFCGLNSHDVARSSQAMVGNCSPAVYAVQNRMMVFEIVPRPQNGSEF